MVSIQENVSLLPFNTFGIDAKAKYFARVSSEGSFIELTQHPVFKNNKRLLLGGGSNLLFTKDFDGLVVKIELKGINIVEETDDEITLQVGAGENWHEFVRHCVQKGWGGIENLSLIPGTVGAAPMQNIGAYGVEIEKFIKNILGIEIATGQRKSFTKSECEFGYRESIFKHKAKNKYLISSVTLTLRKRNHQLNTSYGAVQDTLKEMHVDHPDIASISEAVMRIRRSKLPDPSVVGNAGSFFKNPTIHADLHDFLKKQHPSMPGYTSENGSVKIPAAWLIEQCGWKGKTFNNIGVNQHQALVLVNYGGGDGAKIFELAMKIKTSVKEKFNIDLQPEVNII
ncbi:MAG: UDP-N-acetylmuramate dehydrogenase [Flammeovirgaceae bacterium]|nr:UDP-N-acetylmuramate dehydrogenase [Flammeovirgaceae bacterium]